MKLNLSIPRIDSLKSSQVYSGPALLNSLPSRLRLPVSPSVFKKRLMLHMLSLLGVTWNHDNRYISPCAASNLCCAASGSPYLSCVCALFALVFNDKRYYVRARVCVFTPAVAIFIWFFYSHYRFFFKSAFWCLFQHGLYDCTCTQHTVAHCILS